MTISTAARASSLFLGLLSVVACGDATDLNYMPDDLPAGSCRGSSSGTGGCETDGTDTSGTGTDTGTDTDGPVTTSATGGGSPSSTGPTDQCTQSDECMGAFCVASFDPDLESREAFECVFACLENYSDASWCSDAAACCDPTATCSPRGYCLPAPE